HTHGIVVIGEIGGSEGGGRAPAVRALRCAQTGLAFLPGRPLRGGGTLGHAGAGILGGGGATAPKTRAAAAAGAQVFTRIRDLVEAVVASVGNAKGEKPCS